MNLMIPILLAAASVVSGGSTRISSGRTYFDRKEGFAYFSDGVSVLGTNYQLHADRAYVYMGTTNDLKRIVALGGVAITNETKRAYGAKASYYRDTGMIVLYAGGDSAAEVRDETPSGAQVLRGRKIKFWTESRQVEVLETEITAPAAGAADNVKGMFGR